MAGRALAEAFVRVRADTSGVRKDVRDSFNKAGGDGGKAFGDAFTRDANGRLHDANGKFARELEAGGSDGGRRAGNRFASAFSGSFRRLGPLLGRALGGSATGLGKLTGFAKVATLALTGLAAAAASLNTVVAAGTAFAPLAGLLALIPAAAASAAAAIGTLRLATSGMSDAFKLALTPGTDPKKLAESMKYLSPAARSVVLELNRLRPTLLGIRNAVQQSLFQQLTGQLTAVARVLAGPVRQGAAGVAAQFGLAGRKIAEFARQSQTVELVKAVFGQTQLAIRNLTPALQPVLAGFRALATEGLSFIPGLSQSVANLAARFGTWLQQMVASGKATEWIRNALATLKQLGGIAVQVGGILKSIFSAASASGSGFLGVIGQALAQLNQFLKTAAGQSALKSIFTGLATIGASLAPVIGALVTGLGTLARPLAQLAQLVGPILTTAITALAPALASLAPGLQALFGGLGKAIELVAPALVPLGKAIGQIGVAIGPILPIVGQFIGQLVSGLAPILGQLFIALGPLVKAIVQLAAAFAPLIPPLAQIIVQLVQGLVPALTPLIGLLGQVVGVIGQFFVTALQNLVTALIPLLPTISQFEQAVGQQLLTVLIALSPALIDVLNALIPLLPAIVQLLPPAAQLLTALTPILVLVIRLAAAILRNVIPPIVGLINILLRWSTVLTTNTAIAVAWLVKTLPKIGGWILGAFKGAGKWLYNVGRDIIVGLWNGIASLGSWIGRQLSGLVKAVIPGPVRHVLGIASPSKVMAELGRFAGQGLAVGLDASSLDVSRASARLAGAAVPAVGNNGLTVATAGGGGASRFDVGGLADAVASGIQRAGIAVHMDSQPVGQIISRQQGRLTDQRRRTG